MLRCFFFFFFFFFLLRRFHPDHWLLRAASLEAYLDLSQSLNSRKGKYVGVCRGVLQGLLTGIRGPEAGRSFQAILEQLWYCVSVTLLEASQKSADTSSFTNSFNFAAYSVPRAPYGQKFANGKGAEASSARSRGSATKCMPPSRVGMYYSLNSLTGVTYGIKWGSIIV